MKSNHMRKEFWQQEKHTESWIKKIYKIFWLSSKCEFHPLRGKYYENNVSSSLSHLKKAGKHT